MKRALCLLFLVSVPAALAGSAADPGISAGSILIGGTGPPSISRGAAAYFAYVNDRGGVNGRKIEYRVVNDVSDPLEAARRLVQRDRVFALFNTFGTSTNLAIRDFLNQSGVPQLFVASGATTWGRDARRYPWTIGYVPSYRTEGIVLARQVLKSKPKATIAVLYQDDEDGQDLLAGLQRGLGPKRRQIVKVSSQVVELRETQADVLMVFASGELAGQAMTQAATPGWRPQVYVSAVASGSRPMATGAVSIVVVKDPSDPRWAGDAAIRRYAGAKNGDYVAGLASAFTLVDALKKAGKNPTRAGIMAAARSLNEANNPFVVPGIVVRTGPADGFPIQQVALQRWSGGHWNIFTGPLTIAS